jgi:uncharacterized membrane protein
VAGIVGMIASFVLTYDKIHILKDASYDPGCNINPILSCGSVMKTEQASIFGVPNSVFGLIAFTMLLTIGITLLAGATFKKQLWLAVQIAATAGLVFMIYLFFQGVYRINAICPWCFAVWMVTIPVFWYTTLYNLYEKNIRLPVAMRNFLLRNHGNILIMFYLVLFGLITHRFWYYWSTLV